MDFLNESATSIGKVTQELREAGSAQLLETRTGLWEDWVHMVYLFVNVFGIERVPYNIKLATKLAEQQLGIPITFVDVVDDEEQSRGAVVLR